LGIVFVNIASFVLVPIYAKNLTTSEFGTLEIVNLCIEIANIIFSAGLGTASLSLYSKEIVTEKKNRVISTALIAAIIFGICGTFLLLNFSSSLTKYFFGTGKHLSLLRIGAFLIFIQLSAAVPMAFILARMDSKLYLLVSASQSCILLGLNIFIVVFLKMRVEGIIIGNLIGNTFITLLLITYTFSKTGFSFDRETLRSILLFGLPFVPGGLFLFVLNSADRFFIQKYLDSSTVGIYSLGYKLGTVVATFVLGPFLKIWTPYMFDLDRNPNKESAFRKPFLYLASAYCIVALTLALFSQEIVILFSNRGFWQAHRVIPLVLLAYLFWTTAAFFDSGFYITQKTFYKPLIMGITAALIYFLYWLLIPTYGILGGAYATMICFGFFSLLTYVFSMKIYPVNYPLSKFGCMTVIGIGFYLIGSNLFTQVKTVDIIGKGILTICYPLAILTVRIIDKNDLYMAQKYVYGLRHRFVTAKKT